MGLRRVALGWVAAVLGLTCGAGRGQDSRGVVEPRYPAICKILYAQLAPVDGALPEDTVERHYRDNDRLERAMEGCPAGKSVVLHTNKNGRSVFLIGPLRLRAGITLVVEGNASVWGSRDPRNYDVTPGSCGVLGALRGAGCLPLILAEDAAHSGVMGDGVIDGRGGAKLLGGLKQTAAAETWWELAQRAKVEGGTAALPGLLIARRSNDFTLYRVTLRNSANTHVAMEAVDGVTVWGVKIDAPKWARGTDGIDLRAGTTNVSIVDTYVRAGNDNISPKAGAGGGVTHISVRDTHFFDGHGFGIGNQTSGGVSGVRVDGLTIDGADNGLRIRSDKSRGGVVEDVRFENVCMRGVARPIVLDPLSTAFDGTQYPVYRNLAFRNVRSLGDGEITLVGLDALHRLEATLDNVTIDGEKSGEVTARHASLAVRRGNLEPSGEDVRTTGSAGGGAAYSCDGRFVPFPENMAVVASAEMVPPPDLNFYVAADGTGDYPTVQAALNKVPATGGVVLVAPGVYRERVVVRQSHVTLRGTNADARKTVIVSDATRGTGLGFATVTVRSDEFVAENVTFQNDFFTKAGTKDPMAQEAQALHLTGDRNVLRNVRLLGNQHTAYFGAKGCAQASRNPCEVGRTLVAKSYLAGNIDFIYGDGLVYFDECELHSTEHALVQGAMGFVTAQGKHYPGQASAFVFRNARLTAEAGVTDVYLGQPWRDLSTVIYLRPQIGTHVAAAGFRERMPGAAGRIGTAFFRVYQALGMQVAAKTLTAQEAAGYGVKEVLGGKDGWDAEGIR